MNMTSTVSTKNAHKLVERWLWVVYGMVCLMIIVGGTTRLTGSGLSMVEWRPLMGTLPPMSQAEWARVFEMYQASPQYLSVNSWMNLTDFKVIFFWEYLHRLIGRLIGLVFFIPMLVLWLKGHLLGSNRWRAVVALCLGGCQGLLGWYMVKSGLVDIPAVSHYRLAAHLSLAFFLGSFVLWWILDLKTQPLNAPRGRWLSGIFLSLLAIQIVYGAFVAGTRAGYMYSSFPLLNGALFPAGAWLDAFGLHNLIDNRELLNVIHRWLAVCLGIFGTWIAIMHLKSTSALPTQRIAAWSMLTCLIAQVVLGVLTVMFNVPVFLGTVHQITAFFLLSSALWLHHSHRREPVSHESAHGLA